MRSSAVAVIMKAATHEDARMNALALQLFALFLYLPAAEPPAPPGEKLPPPRLSDVVPQPENVRGWRVWPVEEPLYGYARDRYGYWRPRIVLGPYGHAYYPLTGQPYPHMLIRTRP